MTPPAEQPSAQTSSAPSQVGAPVAATSAWRIGGIAAIAVLAPALGVFFSGVLQPEARTYFLVGVGAALIVGALCLFNKARLLRSRKPDVTPAMSLQAALAVDFAAMLGVAAGGMLLLNFTGTKFQAVAAFGLAFAFAVFLFQMIATALLVHGQQAQSKRPPAPTGSTVS